ncbi:MAG: hypothetical protein HOW97_05470 [Catenulispora sp.]|nr:hypothetical protein [Catenulispora sp.]
MKGIKLRRTIGPATSAVALVAALVSATTAAAAMGHGATGAARPQAVAASSSDPDADLLPFVEKLNDITFSGGVHTTTGASDVAVGLTLPTFGGTRYINLGYTNGNVNTGYTYAFSDNTDTTLSGTVKVYLKTTHQVWIDLDYTEAGNHQLGSLLVVTLP